MEFFKVGGGLYSAGALISCSAIFGVFVYYYKLAVNKPKIIGTGHLKQKLLNSCPILKEHYWPTFWAFHMHLTTIVRSMIQRCPSNVHYTREVLTLSDGGEVALDWGVMTDATTHLGSGEDRNLPVLLILPGLTGSSTGTIAMHLSLDGIATGYRPVVFNQRGNGGIKLKTMRIYSASNIEDLSEVICHIRKQYPNSFIAGVGLSLGGMILTQYQHRLGDQCLLSAVIACSASWDPHATSKSLEENFINRTVYSRILVNDLKKMYKRHRRELPREELYKHQLNEAMIEKACVVSEFDAQVTVPLFGFSSLDEYYNDSRNRDKIHKIQKPLVCITAEDDPFVPKESLPLEEFEANPNTVMILTSHGGHFGFIEGIYPSSSTWMNRTIKQLLLAFKRIAK